MRRPTVNPQARTSLGRGDVSRSGRGWGRSAGAAGCGNESSGGSGGEGGDLDEFHGNRFGWNDRRSKVRRDLILPVRISGARSKAVARACPERLPCSGRFSLPSAAGPPDEVVAQAVLSVLQVEDRLARFLTDPGVPVERPRGVVDRLVVDLRLPGIGLAVGQSSKVEGAASEVGVAKPRRLLVEAGGVNLRAIENRRGEASELGIRAAAGERGGAPRFRGSTRWSGPRTRACRCRSTACPRRSVGLSGRPSASSRCGRRSSRLFRGVELFQGVGDLDAAQQPGGVGRGGGLGAGFVLRGGLAGGDVGDEGIAALGGRASIEKRCGSGGEIEAAGDQQEKGSHRMENEVTGRLRQRVLHRHRGRERGW